MQQAHGGRRATACHNCMLYSATIEAITYQLARVRKELKKYQQ
ncbi:MAG TPA: hypothetical protein VEW42_03515 [Candidatus Eisenbacteria bacterium]|nr:hypothetical protein [Candidatus Eisenbacteria bacterium]